MSCLRRQASIAICCMAQTPASNRFLLKACRNEHVSDELRLIMSINGQHYYVYILASKRNGTLYTGMTNDLLFRVHQHKNDLVASFTKKYQVHRLVYFEVHENPYDAILREKRIKK